jgi:hypothetical protein
MIATALAPAPATSRHLIDHFCPACGMFLTSTDAPDGRRIRVRCTSKRCKGKVREIVIGQQKEGTGRIC